MDNNQSTPDADFDTVNSKLKGFRVYEVQCNVPKVPSYSRRDFYKISLNTGKNIIHYADRGFETDGTILFFGNPYIPYSWEVASPVYSGYAAVFTEDFLRNTERSESLQESPLFKIGGNPVFTVGNEQKEFLTSLFKKMYIEQATDYQFKDDMMRNYINLIIHEALKMQPPEIFFKQKNASKRITSLFLELLERQFPIENTDNPLKLRTAQDFAQNLSIHVNHLNRSVREVTGKSTTAHISERIIHEAKALLQHTSWSTAEIAYGLGFDYPTYFNNYFKRITGTVPRALRNNNI